MKWKFTVAAGNLTRRIVQAVGGFIAQVDG
jgi:hypothetical protein